MKKIEYKYNIKENHKRRFIFQFSETGPSNIDSNESIDSQKKEEPKSTEEINDIITRSDNSIKTLSSRFNESTDSLSSNPSIIDAKNALKLNQLAIDAKGNEALSIIEDLGTEQGLQLLQKAGLTSEQVNTTFEKAGMEMSTAEAYLGRISLMKDDPVSLALLANSPSFFQEHANSFDSNEFNLINFHDLNAKGERTELGYDSKTKTFINSENSTEPLNGKKDFAVLSDGSVLVGHKHVNLVGHGGASMNLSFAGTVTFKNGAITSWNKDTGHFKTGGTDNPYKNQTKKINSINDFSNLT